MVSAWASENRMVLGQVKVDDKSNEITAIPQLLEVLDLSGCIVTIDAMGCQKDIAARIVVQDADYVLALKGSQSGLFEDVQELFDSVEYRYYISSLTSGAKRHLEVTRSHWRIENELHWVLDVAFDEDQSRLRRGHGSQNFAVLRHIAVNGAVHK